MKTLVSTIFLGLPIFAWGGLVVLTLIIIQVLIGAKVLKVDFRYHRINGYTILALVLIHATSALIYLLG